MQKPQKMRQMLEAHGEVGRLYLSPEMASLRAKRKKFKGNTGKNFTEGWVEFEDKRVAKTVRFLKHRSLRHETGHNVVVLVRVSVHVDLNQQVLPFAYITLLGIICI